MIWFVLHRMLDFSLKSLTRRKNLDYKYKEKSTWTQNNFGILWEILVYTSGILLFLLYDENACAGRYEISISFITLHYDLTEVGSR